MLTIYIMIDKDEIVAKKLNLCHIQSDSLRQTLADDQIGY